MLWLFKQKRPPYFELTAGNELWFHKLLIGELASECGEKHPGKAKTHVN